MRWLTLLTVTNGWAMCDTGVTWIKNQIPSKVYQIFFNHETWDMNPITPLFGSEPWIICSVFSLVSCHFLSLSLSLSLELCQLQLEPFVCSVFSLPLSCFLSRVVPLQLHTSVEKLRNTVSFGRTYYYHHC